MRTIASFSVWVALNESMARIFFRNLAAADRELVGVAYANERAGFLAVARLAALGMLVFLVAGAERALVWYLALRSFDNAGGGPVLNAPVPSVEAWVSVRFLLVIILYAGLAAFCGWLWQHCMRNARVLERAYFAHIRDADGATR
jgi:hypothetical protein